MYLLCGCAERAVTAHKPICVHRGLCSYSYRLRVASRLQALECVLSLVLGTVRLCLR